MMIESKVFKHESIVINNSLNIRISPTNKLILIIKDVLQLIYNFSQNHSTTVVVSIAQIYLIIILWKLQVDNIYTLFSIVLLFGFLTGAMAEIINKPLK